MAHTIRKKSLARRSWYELLKILGLAFDSGRKKGKGPRKIYIMSCLEIVNSSCMRHVHTHTTTDHIFSPLNTPTVADQTYSRLNGA